MEKYKYLIERVSAITCLPQKYVEAVLQPRCFEGKTLRSIVNSYENIDDQLIKVLIYKGKRVHHGILRLYAIMKNLGVDGNELVECYRRVLEDGVDVMPYIVGVLYMAWKMPKRFEKNVDHIICANIKEKKGNGKSKPIYDIKIKGYNDDSNCLDYDLQVTTLETFRRSKKVPNPTEFNGRYLMRLLNMNDFENLPKVLDNFVA